MSLRQAAAHYGLDFRTVQKILAPFSPHVFAATVDRVAADTPDERQGQHPVQAINSHVPELRQTNGPILVPRGGLRALGVEEEVPPRQVEPEIAVRLAHEHRMVDPVHVRRDHR